MSERPIRLAIIGAGAVTEKRHLPAAEAVADVEVIHLVDLDLERARHLAGEFGVPHVTEDYREVIDEADAAVIATPPVTHRPIGVELLEAGVHVLCEKPLAPGVADVEAMVTASDASSAILSVAMVRRCGRAARLLRRFVRLGLPGEVRRIEVEEGGEFGWPLRTSHIFQSDQGGVLRDTGTHLLDLAFWLLGARAAQVSHYRDDSWGGPEANAEVGLKIDTAESSIEGRVEVSFTRALQNRIRIHGSEGLLEAPTLGGAEIVFRPSDGMDPVRLVPGDGLGRSRVEDFVVQLEEFVGSIRNDRSPPVPARSALLVAGVIEECLGSRRRRLRAWEAPPGREADPEEERESVGAEQGVSRV